MATRLEKTLKRELTIDGRPFVLSISPQGLKLTLKGHRKGQELRWSELVSGEAALAIALNASVGRFAATRPPTAAREPAASPTRATRDEPAARPAQARERAAAVPPRKGTARRVRSRPRSRSRAR